MENFFAAGAFAGKTVLVTGSTSGIGAGTAKAFAAYGAQVMVSGRNRQRGEAVVAEINTAGGAAELIIGDVAEAEFCETLVAESVKRFGRLDILVNNAGIAIQGKITSHSNAAWQAVVNTNISSVFYLSRAAIGPMKQQGGGVIINASSGAGRHGVANFAAYCSTKAAMWRMSTGFEISTN